MTPGTFPQANRTLTKPKGMIDAECGSLPTYSDGTTCISLWRLSWRERIVALLFGKVWLGVLSGHTQPPVWLAVRNPFGGSWLWRLRHGGKGFPSSFRSQDPSDRRHDRLARPLRWIGAAALLVAAGAPVLAEEPEGVRLDVQVWAERAFTGEVATTIAGGRISVEGPLAVGDQGVARVGIDFDVTAINGESQVDFTNIETIGTHAELRAHLAREIGRFDVGDLQSIRTSVLGVVGFATALDRDPLPLRRYPRYWGSGVRLEERKSGAYFDAWWGRYEPIREDLGLGQLCVGAEVPLGPVLAGGDFCLDLKNDGEGRDAGRFSLGTSYQAIKKALNKDSPSGPEPSTNTRRPEISKLPATVQGPPAPEGAR